VSLSRGEILFKPEGPVDPGSVIEAWVDWPARLENGVALRLYAQGEVQEPKNGYAVLKILQHDFRIAPKAAAES
jgi:hypothetical protein